MLFTCDLPQKPLVVWCKKGESWNDSPSFWLTNSTLFLFGLLLGDEIAASLEFGDFLGGNFDSLASLRVLGGAGFALDNAEGAEADESHFLSFVQLLSDGGEASIHSLFGGHFGHAGLLGHGVNKFGFVHNDYV